MSLAGLKHENGFGPGGTTIAGIGLVKKKIMYYQCKHWY